MPLPAEAVPAMDAELALRIEQLLDVKEPKIAPLHGGVSSVLWRVDTESRTYCVKRALPRLLVADEWYAPVRRNVEEVRWLRFAATVAPRQVPEVVADDPVMGFAILSWFDPQRWTNWKLQLLDGLVRPAVGTEMGQLLAALHRKSAAQPELAHEFDNIDLLNALRLEPYFIAAGEHNPQVEARLYEIVLHLRNYRTALVHGDVSPKNILIHVSRPPVLLDAECACWADPAFDVAFLASHLFLKSAHMGGFRHWFYETIGRLVETYEAAAPEPVAERLCFLVPALLLARIDGKSPVEYLKDKVKTKVRDTAVRTLLHPPESFAAFAEDWKKTFHP
jgi:aminoglycoside phosphotransferase (APT) family kinase protein